MSYKSRSAVSLGTRQYHEVYYINKNRYTPRSALSLFYKYQRKKNKKPRFPEKCIFDYVEAIFYISSRPDRSILIQPGYTPVN